MTVIRPSKIQRDSLFAALVAVFVLAFIRGYPGATTTGGRIAVIVFAGAVTSLLLLFWVRMIRKQTLLEVTPQAVTLVEPTGKRTTLSRESGDEIFVTVTGGGRYRTAALTIAGSGTLLPLSFFSMSEIKRQCLASGWQFHEPGWRRNRG
ncbi:MAG TPA: hypothetical protein VHJ18_10295 [Streptosporangiaceae bacterium]|nr:hypothetical protein [Streptosporangiaceae bacterium]